MPKQEPPVIETFSFTLHNVPKEKVGDLYAAADKLDLTDIEVKLVKNVLAYKVKRNDEVKSTDFIMKWSEDHVHFKAIEAVNAFATDGRSKTAAYPAIATLVEKGLLKKLGPGEYARADQKVLPAPTKETKEKKPKKAKPKREHKVFDKTGPEAILSYARRNHGRCNSTKLLEIFEKEGRAKNSVSASLDKLLKQKMIKRVGDGNSGQYVLLNKAQTPRKKAIIAEKTEPPKTNGNGAHIEQTEMTDG